MSPNLIRLDAVRVFLIRELDSIGTPPAEKEPWMTVPRWYEWISDEYNTPRHQDLVFCLAATWEACEEAETEAGLPHQTVAQLRKEGSHLLKGAL